jgi:hypothetical protein
MTAENPEEQIRCVHCLTPLPNKEISKDHVFPSSWYTEDTSPRVQRSSCKKCNGRFGDLEKELFLRLAVCTDPAKARAAGINRKLLRSFGIGPDISDREKEIRRKLKAKIFAESTPYTGDETLPGLGPHQGFSPEAQRVMLIPADLLFAVLEKVFRGSEYILNKGRYIEPPHSIKIYHVHEEPASITQVLRKFATTTSLGPGFELTRATPNDDERMALYKAMIWGTLVSYASIDVDSEV